MQQRKVLPGSVTFVSLVLRQGIRPPMKPTVGVVRHSIKLAACAPKISKLSVFVLHTSRHVEVPSVQISSACFCAQLFTTFGSRITHEKACPSRSWFRFWLGTMVPLVGRPSAVRCGYGESPSLGFGPACRETIGCLSPTPFRLLCSCRLSIVRRWGWEGVSLGVGLVTLPSFHCRSSLFLSLVCLFFVQNNRVSTEIRVV